MVGFVEYPHCFAFLDLLRESEKFRTDIRRDECRDWCHQQQPCWQFHHRQEHMTYNLSLISLMMMTGARLYNFRWCEAEAPREDARPAVGARFFSADARDEGARGAGAWPGGVIRRCSHAHSAPGADSSRPQAAARARPPRPNPGPRPRRRPRVYGPPRPRRRGPPSARRCPVRPPLAAAAAAAAARRPTGCSA